jgi:hypothetical protein
MKGRSKRIPHWAKGRKLTDAIDGSEIFERDSSTTKQRGQYIHKSNYDNILDVDRPTIK